MKLYFMRHGEASDDAKSDELWLLTHKARSASIQPEMLKKINVTLDSLYASPRLRAQQTASIVGQYLKRESKPR